MSAPHLHHSDNKLGRGAKNVILNEVKNLLADDTLSTVILNALSVILSTLSVILSVAKDLLADHTLSTVIQNTLSVILSVAKDLEVCATIHRL